jgi:catechol 2,3-dioxygenase-like lactoylglutathione lyase family enzyme
MDDIVEKPRLTGAEPQLFVADIQASCDFFTLKLGFDVAFVYGDPPFYAQVFRDDARLNLRHVDAPLIDSKLRAREDLLSAIITLDSADGIKALFREVQEAGAPLHQELRLEPWGARTFIVGDPDGNLLLFADR